MKIWEPRKKNNTRFDTPPSKTDPQGSWTGRPADEDDVPVQDADDL